MQQNEGFLPAFL